MPEPRRALDVLTVSEPCTEDWSLMRGDERVRSCALCRRHVYDLSAITQAEAEALLSEREGRICVRFYRREDGTVTTSDCAPDRIGAARKKARRALVWSGVMLGGLLTAIGGAGLAALFGYHELVLEHAADDPCDVPLMGEPVEYVPPDPIEAPESVHGAGEDPAPAGS